MMSLALSKIKIFVRPGYTDMRKSINGLSGIVQNAMFHDPLSNHLYLFANRKRNIIKALYWDRNGFCIWQKRLEQDRFPWPKDDTCSLEITSMQFDWLLRGIDFFSEHQNIKYSLVS